ncbi:hypothetical protein SteCoe_14666 [Stentor coeruleus]|uniref:Receptor ligand binding region domain-containing protein n=1 Tax=Stentor coeruleus TaxID=5963 RepID=A0A1R2C5M3_9CILI|nr:hypothetical protein SteCoe_14666 [Stentor coeruleus]
MVLELAFILLVSVNSISLNNCLIFISPNTPSQLTPYFNQEATIFLNSHTINSEDLRNLYIIEPLIIDATFSYRYLPSIIYYSEYYNIPYITLTRDTNSNSNQITLHKPFETEVKALEALLKYYNLTAFDIISSGEIDDSKISESLKNKQAYNRPIVYFFEDDDETKVMSIVKKMLKVKGLTKFVIVDKTEGLGLIQKAFENENMVKNGLFLLFSSQSIPEEIIEGSVFIREAGLENATNIGTYHYLAIENCLNYINTHSSKSSEMLDGITIKEILNKYNNQNTSYIILNSYQGKLINVGNITNIKTTENYEEYSIKMHNKIYFPGNTTEIFDLSEVKIVFGIASGANEIYNLYTAPQIADTYKGAEYAISQINEKKLIPGFYIETFPTDCGVFEYEPNWYKECFKSIYDKLGIAYITSFFGGGLRGNYLTLKEYGVTIPQISPLGALSGLDNATEYFEVFKFEETLENFIYSWLFVFQSFGYRDIAVIGSHREGFDFYPHFVEGIKINGFRIANDENNMEIPANYTRDNFDEYKDFFIKIKETRCNVFFIMCIFPAMVVEALYDVGIRKAEFFLISPTDTVFQFFTDVSEPYLSKRKELLVGSFAFTLLEWIGEKGQQTREELMGKYPYINNMCLNYDTVSVIKEAILYLITKGEDFEDPYKLIKAMRNNKVIGCIGSIVFSKETTGRASAQYALSQVFYDENIKNAYIVEVAHFDRFSDQIITIVNDIKWPEGNKISNYRPENPCNFDSFMVKSSTKGKILLYTICAFCFLVTLIIFIYTLKNKNNIEPLTHENQLNFEDIAYFAYFPFQFFQFLVMGPDENAYKYLLNNFQVLLALNYDLYFNVKFSLFWYIFTFNFILVTLWILFSLIYILNLDYRYPRFFSSFGFNRILKTIIPIIGHIGYLPLISMLMSIYLCIDGISDKLQDSFMMQDCTSFCYKGKHLYFVIFTTILLCVFIVISTLSRSYWEKSSTLLNLRTSPIYLSALSLLQILLVILNKSLKTYDQMYHGITCSIIIFLFLIATIVYKPYNYERAFISQITSLIGSIWGISTSTFFLYYSNINNWFITEIIGLLGILVAGAYFFNRSPKLLKMESGVSISDLFLFQFSKEHYDKDKIFAHLNLHRTSQAYMIEDE